MKNNAIKDMIKRHEGFRKKIYLDTEGVPTVGYGHALHVGSKVPQEVCELLFERDFNVVLGDYKSMNLNLDDIRRGVILDMLFNLGLPRLLKFKKMLTALRAGFYTIAADEMKDSKWFRQVGGRGVELVEIMRTGRIE